MNLSYTYIYIYYLNIYNFYIKKINIYAVCIISKLDKIVYKHMIKHNRGEKPSSDRILCDRSLYAFYMYTSLCFFFKRSRHYFRFSWWIGLLGRLTIERREIRGFKWKWSLRWKFK